MARTGRALGWALWTMGMLATACGSDDAVEGPVLLSEDGHGATAGTLDGAAADATGGDAADDAILAADATPADAETATDTSDDAPDAPADDAPGGPDATVDAPEPSPQWPTACDPCTSSATCNVAGSPTAACAAGGAAAGLDGWFCAPTCQDDAGCPAGSACLPAVTVEGGFANHCMPLSGTCTCSSVAVAQQLATTCASTVKLPDGTVVPGCKGTRTCSAAGLTVCSAPVPVPEQCDGQDQDCDGKIDDGATCDDGNPCTTDACQAGACTSTANTAPCDDGTPCTGADTCQGGACVGQAVACDDGNPCTQDACQAGTDAGAGNCLFTAQNGGCEDGSACTVGDACKGGKCQPGESLNCDDGNACTDDGCAPTTSSGCFHDVNTAACTDGSACTSGDACQGGTCKATAIVCSDGKACTADSCAPTGDAAGCVFAPIPGCVDCQPGFQAQNGGCVDVDECAQPGTCAAAATCANTAGGYTCTCKPGYGGDGQTCTDVDECAAKTAGCAAQAVCANTPGSYTCTCASGTVGDGKTCAKKGSSAEVPAVSCLEILTLDAGAGDGGYWLDFDGPGGAMSATKYHCDMKNGGWTRIFADDFESGSASGWSPGAVHGCGGFGKILGGPDGFGNAAVTSKSVALLPPHSQAKVYLHYLRLDSWNGEHGLVGLDGKEIFSKKGNLWNGKWVCGVSYVSDEKWDVQWTGAHTAPSATLAASSTLNQNSGNESFGIDNTSLWVR